MDVTQATGNDEAEEILRMADQENIDTIVVCSREMETKEFLLGVFPIK